MSLVTPTTQEISDNIIAQLEASLSQTIPLLPKAFSRVLAKALAGVFVLLYKYAGFIFLQMFVSRALYADTEINGKIVNPLVEWGRLIGVGDPTDAIPAEHTITIVVLNQTGSLPAGSQLVRPETGVIYQTLAAVTLDAATKTVDMIAISDQDGNDGSGTIGNLEVNDIVEFANPQANVAREATVLVRTVDGADAESEEAYRSRVVGRFQTPPQGGAYADYWIWSVEVEGIVKAYPYTGDPGEVDVYCEATEASSGSPDGIPTQAQLDAVADSIELDDSDTGLATRRPANAAVNVLAITRTTFDLEIAGLVADDPDAVKSLISDGVDEYLRAAEPFIVGLSKFPRLDRITSGSVSGLVHEIAAAEGATVNTITLLQSSTVITAWTLGEGEKAKLGTITYTG